MENTNKTIISIRTVHDCDRRESGKEWHMIVDLNLRTYDVLQGSAGFTPVRQNVPISDDRVQYLQALKPVECKINNMERVCIYGDGWGPCYSPMFWELTAQQQTIVTFAAAHKAVKLFNRTLYEDFGDNPVRQPDTIDCDAFIKDIRDNPQQLENETYLKMLKCPKQTYKETWMQEAYDALMNVNEIHYVSIRMNNE